MRLSILRPEVGEGVVHAFRRVGPAETEQRYRLRGVDPAGSYKLTDLDRGSLGVASGKILMDQGLVVPIGSRPGSAVILIHGSKTKPGRS